MKKSKLIDLADLVHDEIGNYSVRELTESEVADVAGGSFIDIACPDIGCDTNLTDCGCIADLWCDDGSPGGTDWWCNTR